MVGYRVGDYHPKFKENIMQLETEEIKETGVPCGCGRSPTGNCIGWHGLSEAVYEEKKREWELAEYKKQASELWSDSCTSGRSE